MCTLAIYFQVLSHYPVVIATNRDELLNRPSAAPTLLWKSPWIVGGRDLIAGGTWLGVNAAGMAAGVLNRRSTTTADPTKRSRGQLCLEVLKRPHPEEALAFLVTQRTQDYNPFNLLIATPTSAYVVHSLADTMSIQPLLPGLHLLTNLNLNDPNCPRTARSYQRFAQAGQVLLRSGSFTEFLSLLHTILSDHATPADDPHNPTTNRSLCIHSHGYGTRSSSLIAYASTLNSYRYLFAPGPPCTSSYHEIPWPQTEKYLAPFNPR
jgi:uncharacterized protein with NRDE domain